MTRPLWIKLGVLILIVFGMGWGLHVFGVHLTHLTPERVRAFILSFGFWAPAMYLVVYGQPIVPLPASILLMTAGLAFGPVWGTLAALCASTSRACGQFLLARFVGREFVTKRVKGRVAAISEKIGHNGFTAVLLIRLIPNVPFDIQNYTLGVSLVRFRPYALGTVLGMIPASFAYVYFGYSLTDLHQIWKLFIAIFIILGLVFWQHQFAKRKKVPS